MCDKKYIDETYGILLLKNYLADNISEEKIDIVFKIITTMSYSKVKVNGYPNLGEYQLAYHIVREADLLTAYDIDRCIIYSIYQQNVNYDMALQRAFTIFDNRVLNYISDNLFITDFSKRESLILHDNAKKYIELLKLNR